MIVTEEEHSPAMEHGLQSALSYLEKEKLADINLNNISLTENQMLASTKSLDLGMAYKIIWWQWRDQWRRLNWEHDYHVSFYHDMINENLKTS